MAIEIIHRRDGADIETITHPGPAEAAIASAGDGLVARKTHSARLRDIAGSTAEICSLRSDGKGSYIRDDRA
jgi:hypothetical protein